MKVNAGTIARTAVLAVSLLNVLLNAFGKNPLPFSDDAKEHILYNNAKTFYEKL